MTARIALIGTVIAVLIAAVGQAGRAGAQGQAGCGNLNAGDFKQAGETWMGRMLGSAQAHDAMDRLMASMMGSDGVRQMHEYMGRQTKGCGGGVPGGFGRMMGMMAGGAGSAGMMGQVGDADYGSMMDGMMGGSTGSGRSGADDDDDSSGWAVALMIGVIVLVLAGLYFFLRGSRADRPADSPADLLRRRFASGEISRDEYERCLKMLSG